MIKTKWLHIISNVLVVIFAGIILFNYYLVSTGSGSWSGVTFSDIPLVYFLLSFFILTWSIYFIRSYFKTNIENKHFRISSLIVIFASVLILIFPVVFAGYILKILNIILLVSYPIAFIIFLIGYYKNKK
jgi:hypothetical protein|tara:strand:+ start:139 stop:528 length:390 start_codon:yes stop_codon:yes gene_type:complete